MVLGDYFVGRWEVGGWLSFWGELCGFRICGKEEWLFVWVVGYFFDLVVFGGRIVGRWLREFWEYWLYSFVREFIVVF